MDVGPALVADGQAAKASEPGQRALNHPPVATQALAAFNASASDARGDGSPAQGSAATAIVVGFIAVQLGRSPARPPGALADRWHGIDQRLHVQTVMAVGRAQADGQGDAGAIGEDVALGARPTTIRRVWADLVAPFFAGMAALSSAARLPSMALAIPSRSSSTRCSRAHTPASCQSRRRRQQVMPDPQPISSGRRSHAMPVPSTNTMPVKARRSSRRGRPPFGFGGSGGSNGAITAHRPSGRSGFAIPLQPVASTGVPGFVRGSKTIATEHRGKSYLRRS